MTEHFIFLGRKKLKDAKKLLLTIIASTQKNLRKRYGLTFEYFFVGSGKPNLTLIQKNKNNRSKRNLFDLDLQIVFHKFDNKTLDIEYLKKNLKYIINPFMKNLKKSMTSYNFQLSKWNKVQKWNSNNYNFSFDIVLFVNNKSNNINEDNVYKIIKDENNYKLNKTAELNLHSVLARLKHPTINQDIKLTYKELKEKNFNNSRISNYELLIQALQKVYRGDVFEVVLNKNPRISKR